MNEYTFTIVTESMTDDSVSTQVVPIEDVTPYEAWKRLFAMMANLEENDSVILSITLR